MRSALRRTTLAAAAVCVAIFSASCASQPTATQAGQPSTQTSSQASQTPAAGIATIVDQTRDLIGQAAKDAEGWQGQVTTIRIGADLQRLQNELQAAGSQAGEAQKKAAQTAADDLAKVLAAVRAQAAAAPGGSSQKAGLDKLAAALEQAQKDLAGSTTASATAQQTSQKPSIAIDSPKDGAALPAGDVTVRVTIKGFQLVGSGSSMAPGRGMIIYRLGNTLATTDQTQWTFKNVGKGTYRVIAALVYKSGSRMIPQTGQTVHITVK